MPTLLLAQRFPPHQGAAARRLGWLARRLAEHGEVFVIRRGEPGGQPIPEVAQTIAIGTTDLRKLSGYEGRTVGGGVKANPVVNFLLRLRQAYPLVYLADDGGWAYRRQAFVAACALVEAHGITTILSSFRPWSDHLMARQLKRKYPQLRWVADFRDLPVDLVRQDVWWPALQRWWGKRVIAGADEVWAVSEGQRQQLAGWHANLKVVRNPLLSLPPAENNPVTERFTIVYTGSLYAGLQTVVPLVEALQQLLAEGTIAPDKFCLRYRGKDAELFGQWTAGLPENCRDIAPPIAPAAAQKMQRTAQVLLLLNWSAPGYYGVLTAKLWDYLATGRPILALVNGPHDPELAAIVAGANAGAVFAEQEQGLADWLHRTYARWEKTGTLPWVVDREELNSYLGYDPLLFAANLLG
ncbi:MAG: hypothetical protein AAF597_02440 [Bacteroidota bacterium]